MPQLSFVQNYPLLAANSESLNQASVTFFGYNIYDSISFKTLNLPLRDFAAVLTINLGLYSLNGSTLSLANSISQSHAGLSSAIYVSMTGTSATQNITPGTWYWGIMFSTQAGGVLGGVYQGTRVNPGNAFPGGFFQGRMTVSTAAMPASIATSDLDITGRDALVIPYIILCS